MDTYSKNPESSGQKAIILSLVSGVLIAGFPILGSFTPKTEADLLSANLANGFDPKRLIMMEDNTLIPPSNRSQSGNVGELKVVITGYSSSVWETDDTPYITAAGTWVRDGIIANNALPFGTKVRIPELYGNKIFVVEDRMHRRKSDNQIDIWFPSYGEAIDFGVKSTYIEVLGG